MNEQNFQLHYNRYQKSVERRLAKLSHKRHPASVYDPIRFVIGSGGKRLRASLVMLACESVGGKAGAALDAAAAIEMLHNFTLVHDDVMDHALLRRGRPAVHRKWNENVAILAGDEMIGLAYESLLKTPTGDISAVVTTFTRALVEVCEGQGLDKEFESRKNVSLKEYVGMIEKKTARIIASACVIGGMIGAGTRKHISALRTFGEHLGIAFQMKDDLLDIAGEVKDLGKVTGSDVIEKKKTFLLLTALSRIEGSDKKFLQSQVSHRRRQKVDVGRVRDIYERHGILALAEAGIRQRTLAAQRSLEKLPASRARGILSWLSGSLSERNR